MMRLPPPGGRAAERQLSLTMAALSAVIPNRNGADLLPQTLPPLLRELAGHDHEVLVVDDASEDESVALLQREFPQVRVVELPSNVGFGAACNHGFQEARYPLVLLLNSDMIVTPGSLNVLLPHFSARDVFAAGPAYEQVGEKDSPQLVAPQPRPQLGAPAGGGIFRREVFLKLGGFDALYYPFYWEDLDLGWTAWRQGWRIIYDPRVRFMHLASATIGRLYSRAYVARVRARNRCLFGWKNFTRGWLRRRHQVVVLRRAVVDLLRRGDPAALLGLWDAWRMRRRAWAARPAQPPVRTDEQILTASHTDLKVLLSL
jgi:GT2 family glycosyltransferase